MNLIRNTLISSSFSLNGLSLFILVALLIPTLTHAEGLGRLFFTPAERAQLIHHKTLTTTATPVVDDEVQDTERSLTVNGIVQRNGGRRTAWINGTAKSIGQSDDATPDSVMVNLPDKNKMVRLKVGQHIILSPPVTQPAAKPSADQPAPSNDD